MNLDRCLLTGLLWLCSTVAIAVGGAAGEGEDLPQELSSTLFKNVKVFNGADNKLIDGLSVLVEGKTIAKVSASRINLELGTVVIDGKGMTLMPGLIDGHVHYMINSDYGRIERDMDLTDISIRATLVAQRALMDGFTAARDMGGPAFGLMRNINEGIIIGPKIFPSGAFVSQTSGHGDFRDRADGGFSPLTAWDKSNFEQFGIGTVADGVPEILKAVRTNLKNGATQIKIMAGGGGSSRFDPIDTTQYSEAETCAAVEAAADWGTYVSAHVFNDRAMNRLMDCGVKAFDHGFFMSEETMKRIAQEGVFVVPQMWGISPDLAKNPLMPKDKLPMVAQLQKAYGDFGRNLLKNKVKVVFASDYVGVFSDAERARRYELYWRTQTFDSNFEVLKQLTSNAGELLALSGPRNPYAESGPMGVIKEGAAADLLLVDGNPLKDMSVLGANPKWFDADPDWTPIETLRFIMKDGVIYKNTL
jgi:imidazolonepropionase-like amidohydrolase